MVGVLVSADSKFPVDRRRIRERVEEVVAQKGVKSDAEVSVLVCGERKARELARRYLKDDVAHSVLSFPLIGSHEGFVSPTAKSASGFVEDVSSRLILGDVVVCYPLAQKEANEDNVLVDDKICELVEHGVLHLLGEHHEE